MPQNPRYTLSKKIARGGMAEIYLGKQVGEDGFQRVCAIKRILPHYASEQEFIQMFRDEAHICKRLQHANIVRVEGFEEVEGSYAIIMEYVQGADVRTLLHAVEKAKQRMPVAMACYIIAEAARGLYYAHTKIDDVTGKELKIVHRDISPQNILVSYSGEVKVTDFGIAQAGSKLTETKPGIVKGKYAYMSPEQISAKNVDAKTDIFALSVVLWEMLAMRRLFQSETEVETIQRVKNCRIDFDIRRLNNDVDDELDAIIKKGLAKDAKKRYGTAADFEKDIRRFLSRRFPEFTPEDLGRFLRVVMESQHSESTEDVKRTLTEVELKPSDRKLNSPSQVSEPHKPIDLELDQNDSGALAMAVPRPATATGLSASAQPPMGGSKIPRPVPAAVTSRSASAKGAAFAHGAARNSGTPARVAAFVAMALLIIGIGAKLALHLTAQGRPTQLTIRTQPSRIKAAVDGVAVSRGHFIQASSSSPLKLTLKPGEHTLIVSRPGYHNYKYVFTLDEGEHQTKDDIVLKEKSPLAAVKIRLKPGEEGLRIDIGEGFFVAKFPTGSMAPVSPDLLVNHRYKMRIILDDEKDFFCTLTPRTTSWRAPMEVVIDRKGRKCSVSGS